MYRVFHLKVYIFIHILKGKIRYNFTCKLGPKDRNVVHFMQLYCILDYVRKSVIFMVKLLQWKIGKIFLLQSFYLYLRQKNKFMNKYFKISLYSRLKDFWFLCNQGPHGNWLSSQLLLKKFLHFHMFQNLWKFLKTNTDEFSILQLLSRKSTFALSKWKFGSILSNGHYFSPRNSVWKKKY